MRACDARNLCRDIPFNWQQRAMAQNCSPARSVECGGIASGNGAQREEGGGERSERREPVLEQCQGGCGRACFMSFDACVDTVAVRVARDDD